MLTYISETWLKNNMPNNLCHIDGFQIIRNDRCTLNEQGHIKRGGGLMLYVKDTYEYSDIESQHHTVCNKDLELQTINLKLKNTRPIYIINVYRPPDGNTDSFIKLLEATIEWLPQKNHCHIIMGGDFNIDMARPRQQKSKKLKKFLDKFCLKQYITEKTRPCYSDSIIDLLISNCDRIQYTGLLDWNISDHRATLLNIKKAKTKFEKEEFRGRSYSKFDENIFKNLMRNIQWENHLVKDNPNETWNRVIKIVEECIDKMIPVKRFRFAKSKPEWISNEIIELLKDRDRSLSRASRTKNQIDKDIARKIRNQTNKIIRKAKQDFIKDKLRTLRNDPKKFWEQIKVLIPQSTASSKLHLKDEQGLELNDIQTANLVNTFFSEIGDKLAANIQNPLDNNHTLHSGRLTRTRNQMQLEIQYPTFELVEVTEEQVIKQCESINIYKSSGIDFISSRILKLFFLLKPAILVHIFNDSIKNSSFPASWKCGTVIPIPKITKPMGPGDLRPITLLPLPGKILEHLIHNQLSQFLETNNVLIDNQNGFRKKHSTIDTIFWYLSDLTDIRNRNRDSLAVYIDFKKAFDTVNHTLLIDKLLDMNLGQNFANWTRSYLQNRTVKTHANNKTSNTLPITCGVPQGSVLGPLYFLLYINNIKTVIEHSKFYLYADDIVLIKEVSPVHPRVDVDCIQTDVNCIKSWCNRNKLTINVKKTVTEYFPRNNHVKVNDFVKQYPIYIEQHPVSYVFSFKYLGVEIDQHLSMKAQAAAMYKNASHKLYLLKMIRPCLTIPVALNVCKSMFLSVLDYGNIFITPVPMDTKDDLQKLQNSALRICCNIRDPTEIHVKDLHTNTNVLSLNHRRILYLLTQIYNNIQASKFSLTRHTVNTRHNDG